ncbi:MAG TPA: glycine cleavage system protein T, partial [Sulfurimonas sp.]|nr:glycine cleavage system protein T [Sulfurimonas sp.]
IIAVQGPNAIAIVKRLVQDNVRRSIESLKVFQGAYCGRWFIARTGYTGEKGLEIILPENDAVSLWYDLRGLGVQPVGLGARDTLRLEAGLNLYGSDMDESVTPLVSNMASTVVMEDHEFIGKAALQGQMHNGIQEQLVGLIMTSRGVLRAHYPVFCNSRKVGEITSGAFSPTLQHSVALARINNQHGDLTVEIRNKHIFVQQVTLPFVRHGKQVYQTQYYH